MKHAVDYLAWAIGAAIFVAVVMLVAPARAELRCVKIDPAALIFTQQGVAVTLGESNASVLYADVKYHVGPALFCIPQTGMPRLYLPDDSFPQFADTGIVLAHYEYAWINDRGYKAANGNHCCGIEDCVEIPLRDVREEQGHFMTPYGAVDPKGVYQSRDGKTWVCRRHTVGATPQGACLFIPGGG